MTISDEGKQLRSEIAKLRPDKRRRYGEELRSRILDWIMRCNAEGMADAECAKVIGIKAYRILMWRRYAARMADEDRERLALVPIDSTPLTSPQLTLTTPSGYRVVGLSVSQLVLLLRGLA